MKMTLVREVFTDKSTIGRLFINKDEFFCHTLEDKVRDLKADGSGKVKGATAIPAGTYEVILNFSERFKRALPLLLSVPFFEGVRIHPGNTDEDTDGCILVGTLAGPDAVYKSREAFSLLFILLQREVLNGKLELTIGAKHKNQEVISA